MAVVLGVAMVSGTYVLTDTITQAFDGLDEDSYKDTGAVISGSEVVWAPRAARPPFPTRS